MKGIDISHWQSSVDFTKVKAAGYEFCFMKATQGTEYLDPTYKDRKDKVRASGMLLGAYHFANSTDPIKEAEWFLKNVGDLKEGEIVVLDYENDFLPDPAAWCLTWMSHVESKLGFKPMLYTNEARVIKYNWKSVVAQNFGLWVAKYASATIYVPEWLQRKPYHDEWPFWAIWQYSSKATVPGVVGDCDVNTTSMDIATLKKYGKVENCTHSCPKHCTGT